jgi:hypothetical protein
MGQRCALLWLLMRCHLVLSDTRRCCPNGSIYKQYGRYKNSRTAAAFFVPHQHFSGAKISIISKTAKLSSIFFSDGIKKQRDAYHENLRPLCIELLQ